MYFQYESPEWYFQNGKNIYIFICTVQCTVYRQVQQRIQITISLTFLKTWCLILPRNICNCCRGGEDGLHGPGEVEGQGHQHRGRGLPDTGAQETEHITPALLPTGKV